MTATVRGRYRTPVTAHTSDIADAPGAAGDDAAIRPNGMAGFDPDRLAQAYGTPTFAYDLDVVERTVTRLRAALPARFDLAFAVKANPSLAVVAHIGSLGLGADIASAGELELVGRAGIDPRRVVFTGPGKREDELRLAVDAGIRAVTVESPGELRRLEAIAAARGRRVPVLLRLAVEAASPAEDVRMLGDAGAGKFGMDATSLRRVARAAAASPHLELLGVHAFGASNLLDAAALATHASATMAAGRRIAGAVGVPLRLVDVGGGLGIPYDGTTAPLDVALLGRLFQGLDEAWAADPATATTRVLVEPGRFLVARAGSLVTRVVDTKRAGAAIVVVVDAGIHHLVRPALVGREHRIVRLRPSRSDEPAAWVTVVGPLCSGLDVLAAGVRMAQPQVGDLLAILDAGAYGFTESMPLFLSHPMPAEVAVRQGRTELIRPRLEPSAWLTMQRLPTW